MRSWLLAIGLVAFFPTVHAAEPPAPAKSPATATLAEHIKGTQSLPGFLPLYWDSRAGKLWLQIERFDTDILYTASLAEGVGSNEVGLDRGLPRGTHVVRFTRVGPRVLLVAPNLNFRATTTDAAERRATEESFPQSVLWGFDIAAEEKDRVLVDATAFFLRDAVGVIGALKEADQGTFTLDATRSALFLPHTKNFPKNTEVEVTLTFTSAAPGMLIREVSPIAEAMTVREHAAFVELPPPGFQPRAFDPRAGYFDSSHFEFASPIADPLVQRWMIRHRLEKKDPSAAVSDPVRPIIYYLDPGTPEPVRSALLEGARWWDQAFAAAGYRNAFRVELLPADADPMDIRYNLIQWVHRSTRGWSYGLSVVDPRTGEIIKGKVTLDSQRARQDQLIFEGLLAPYMNGQAVAPEVERIILSRLRQLAAHEVGHTLGLAHNYLASTADRASVMDYPGPLVRLRPDGSLDTSEAYAVGIGAWDKVSIAWGYQDYPRTVDANAARETLLREAAQRGLTFLTDQDARPLGSAHPQVHLWDNGPNAIDELNRLLELRRAALARFGENNVRPGVPLALLEERLVPIYLLHRYQIEAASKSLGGLYYTYALRGDGQRPTTPVPPAEQRRALDALLAALDPAVLRLPENLLDLIPVRPAGYARNIELFKNRTGGTFDALAPAEAAAQLTMTALLEPTRAARLVEFHSRNAESPGLAEVIARIFELTWQQRRKTGYDGEIERCVEDAAVLNLMALANAASAPTEVRAIASFELARWAGWLGENIARFAGPEDQAHAAFTIETIARFQKDPKAANLPKPVEPPPGQPIGEEPEY